MGDQLSPTQLVDLLRADRRERWQKGERILAESYLQRYPDLMSDTEHAAELVYHEVLLREELGEAPRLEEYLLRFPQLTPVLEPLFEVHRAIEDGQLVDDATMRASQVSPAGENAALGSDLPEVPGYEILNLLGHGGMGVVYKARHTRLNRIVALKMILAGVHAQEKEISRFRAEAEAQARLQHPNIVQIYEVGDTPAGPYFALEYVDGGSLAQRLAGTPLPTRAAAQLLGTLARAVHYAHQRGLIHRDLKPANILLSREWRVVSGERRADPSSLATPKITDFGLAKRLEVEGEQTASGSLLGTPSYMAPEQAFGRTKAVGPNTDVYALGALLYEMLTGRPPFLAETAVDTLLQVRTLEPVQPRRLQPKVPRDLETICLKCLQKEPGKRYSNAEALAEDLHRFQAGEPIRARPVNPAERLWRWCRRKPSAAALIATVFLCMVGGSAAAIGYLQHRAGQTVELATRKARFEQEVEVALQEAVKLADRAWTLTEAPHLWESTLASALSAVKRAETLVEDAGGLLEPELRQRVWAKRAELDTDDKDRQLVATLEQIRIEHSQGRPERGFSLVDAIPKYAEAFQRYGVQVGVMPAEQAVERIRSKRAPLRTALVSILDEWARLERKDKEKRGWLGIVVAGADTDHWRNQVRQAVTQRQPDTLVQLADNEAIKQQPAASLILLGQALQGLGAEEHGIRVSRCAQQQYPADFWVNLNLAMAFRRAKPPQLSNAIIYYNVALALRPRNSGVYVNLGTALHDLRDLPGAIGIFQKAIDFDPEFALAYFDLGNALRDLHDFRGAIAAFQKSIDLAPNNPAGHNNLAFVLRQQGDLPRAIVAYQKAADLDPKNARVHNNLGNVLGEGGDLLGAVAAYQKAVDLDPGFVEAYVNLGSNVGALGDLSRATAACQKAIELKPDYAEAHWQLGQALRHQGRFAESLTAYKSSHDLGSKIEGWSHPSARRVEEAERLVELDHKLPAIMGGQQQPADALECLAYARLCRYKRFYVTSVQLYRKAFSSQPVLADVHTNNRYNAVCVAARGGTGQGDDEDHLDEIQREGMRKQALEWLRADLSAWSTLLESGHAKDQELIRKTLRHWQRDAELTALRDEAALAKLPEAERATWQQFWAEVAAVLKRIPE